MARRNLILQLAAVGQNQVLRSHLGLDSVLSRSTNGWAEVLAIGQCPALGLAVGQRPVLGLTIGQRPVWCTTVGRGLALSPN